MEKELFARAGVSLASARVLWERKKEFAPAIELAPNGADVDHFSRAMQPGLPAPPELKALPRPVIGYVGAVSAWFDQEMRRPPPMPTEWSFVLVGPVDTDVAA